MAYIPTGMQALFPIYLGRMPQKDEDRDAYDSSVAQNENNLNQNLELLYSKLSELESALAELTEGE
ncbi:MAG: hypothetical protein IJK12_06665 [Clostridia bacterium]|jgi:hypothetical protein|nr:hypothetical protein [Clostridia bacterium]MBR0436907.1 hypothetical protein [Clostridia bacterium]MBR2644105.1 hypothetical protein [Clostridia bacterium]MBR3037209.1 hypothetical protein [Clostridia bacterium]MBR3129197.1 hypothetical protein [Clostridia bacterium]